MDPFEYLPAIETEAAAMAAAARTAGPSAAVPSCPEWDVAALLHHMGRIHRWAAANATDERGERVLPDQLDLGVPDDPAAYPDWLEAGAAALVAALRTTDPDAPRWAWGPDQHARFWFRRMAHETSIHRWDAQAAVGDPAPIAAALAADGIDETFANLLAHPRMTLRGDGQTIHLHCTDGEGEWLLTLLPDGVTVRHEHAKGDVAARGTASDLALFLVGRRAPDELEVFGDVSLLEAWQRDVRF